MGATATVTPQYDPATGERLQAAPQPYAPIQHVTPDVAQDIFKAGVHAQMLGVSPGTAYDQREAIKKTLSEHGPNYDDGQFDPSIANDVAVGLEGSIFGLHHREKLPDQVRNPGMMDKLVQGLSQMVADSPFMLAGGVLGGAAGGAAGSEVPIAGNITGAGLGTAAGAFALPAAMREVLVKGIKDGEVKDFPDLLRRSADVLWEGTKGAITGVATELSGGLPVGGFLAKSPLAATAVKGLYQATALTTSADLLEGKLPTKEDFAGNAALIIPLNLITHGTPLRKAEANQALMDVYAKNGKTPQESTDTLNAQPPVKPDMPEGLRPAIQAGEGVIDGDANETHATLSERVLAKSPVTMEQLEASPERADSVLENPTIHAQDVIDRAWQIKSDAVEAGDVGILAYHGTPFEFSGAPRTDGLGAHFTLNREGAEAFREDSPSGKVIEASLNIKNPLRIEDHQGSHTDAGETVKSLVKQRALGGDKYTPDAVAKRVVSRHEALLKESGDFSSGPTDEWRKANSEAWSKANNEELERVKRDIKAQGYDGLVYENKGKGEGGGDAYVAFDKEQIKIAGETEKPLTIEDIYDRNAMKSGRGFVAPDGQFLSRMEARKWMKENEPDTHEIWLADKQGDKQAELHSEDYAEARNRAQARNVAQGDEVMSRVSPENAARLAAAREGLNKIKAGSESSGYGKEVLRTLFAGQRDTRIAATTQLRDSIKDMIPDYRDQEALSILRDYKNRPEKLAADLEEIRNGDSERLKGLIPSIERAMNPSPELLKADQALTGYYSQALNEGRELGFMESRIDPANYSPHILTRILEGEQPSAGRGGPMSQSTPFAKSREYPTIIDALKTNKLDARTVNALDALSVYGDRHATVVATKLLATELKNTELGKYGTSNNHPEGWVELAPGQSAFRNTRAIANDGDAFVMSQSFYVPKDVAEAMKPMFEAGLKDTKLAPLLKSQNYVKTLELGLSLFHVKALNVTAFNNMALTDFTKSLVADTKSPEFAEQERGWAADGLTTSKTSTPYEAYKGLEKSSVPTGLDKLADAPVIKQVDALFKGLTEYTFDVVQRKFKVQDASLKAARWMAKNPEASSEEYFAARRSIAREVNAAYGGLNWDVLGTGKTVRDVSRLFLLAPDWTFSNVLNAKYTFEGGPAGSAARMFWAKSFATGIGMTAAASIAIGGKYQADAKHFDQVYLGTDKDGKEMYANWFFAGAPKDAMSLTKRAVSDSPLAGTAEFIVGKASPALGILAGLSANKQASGAPIYKRTDSAGKQAEDQAKFVAGRVVPITGVSAVKTVEQALTDPNHTYSYRDLLELAADALGSPTTHQGSAGASGPTGGRESGTERFQRAGGHTKSRFSIKGKR